MRRGPRAVSLARTLKGTDGMSSSRKLAFLLLAVMLLAAGCGKEKEPSQSQETDSVQEEGEDTQEAEPEEIYEEVGDPGEGFSVTGESVTTPYYTISLPESWQDAVLYHFYEDVQDGSSSLEVCEKKSAQAGMGGILFCVDLTREYPENLEMLPCDYMGRLVSDEGREYYVVFRYPSDVQFDELNEERYTELYRQIPQVMEGFAGAGGYTFEKESS